jgi:hypothetical protein
MRKKPQRGRATRVKPRDINFYGAEKPQGSKNSEGGKAELSNESSSGAQEARYLKGSQKIKRECRDNARMKPSNGKVRVYQEKSSEVELNLITETS